MVSQTETLFKTPGLSLEANMAINKAQDQRIGPAERNEPEFNPVNKIETPLFDPKTNPDIEVDSDPLVKSVVTNPIDRSLRPVSRPKDAKIKRMSPIDAVINSGYLLGDRNDEGITKVVTGLDENNPEQRKAINGMFDSVLGASANYDSRLKAWCATFVSHILNELGADPLKSKDVYDRTRADKYKNYGTKVNTLEDIKEGDVVVLDFDGDGKGDHVGFYAGTRVEGLAEPGYINIVGGNQGGGNQLSDPDNPEYGGAVTIRSNVYQTSAVVAVRRITYDDVTYEFNEELAKENPQFQKFVPSELQIAQLKKETVGYEEGGDVAAQTFAQGGVVDDMNRQMEMFAIGGLSDDGMTRDPVSGNDIPPGSMAEEVRDDIPAQLSEGEYVVPADVVRFFGVRYFEDLRTEAKMGLSNMEANGRIGGEPVPSGGPMAGPTESALTPEEMAALADMGMNVGGFVPQQQPPVQAIGNTQQGMNRGYDEGGVAGHAHPHNSTAPATIAAFDPLNYGLGFSVYGQPSGTEDATVPSTVPLYSPDGVMRSLTLPAEQAEYDRLIAEGWSTEMTAETSVGKKEADDDGGDFNREPVALTLEELKKQRADLNKNTGIESVITNVIGLFGANKIANFLGSDDLRSLSISLLDTEIKKREAEQSGGTSVDKPKVIEPAVKSTVSNDLAIKQAKDKKDKFQTVAKAALDPTSKGQQQAAGIVADSTDPTGTQQNLDDVNAALENIAAGGSGGFKTGGFVSKRTKKKKK